MKSVSRYLEGQIVTDLSRKMVLMPGPRQVGKTTLARKLLGGKPGYLNWDIGKDREHILKEELPRSDLWVFDEIHKYRRWRNYLKGVFDGRRPKQRILVTGSAHLEFYRFGGDSLQGRYHMLRLHPFSVAELGLKTVKEFESLMTLGGFPEPYLSGSEEYARRWSSEHRHLIVREEVAGLEQARDLGHMELLALRLPELVGSPLSINALREDLQVSHATVATWIQIFERLYAVFRLSPFGAPRIRAVKKEQKHYHFDWSVVPEPPARFENLVASHLLKWVHYEQDVRGRELELRYFRDIDGREVDFVVTENRKPHMFVEAKWADTEVDRGLRYLKARFPKTEAWQISASGKKDYVNSDGIHVAPALALLSKLV